jgi:glycosyltransferase involved in cell wall biosynthesis
MVNQFQLLALRGQAGLTLTHEDAPFFSQRWSEGSSQAGFSAQAQKRLDSIKALKRGVQPDWVYEIIYPFFSYPSSSRKPVAHFMVTNFGFSQNDFQAGGGFSPASLRDQDIIVTPSEWSRQKIIRFGFPHERVHVVHHGVDTGYFRPSPVAERALIRQQLGIEDDEYCFLNIGAMSINKAIDVLVKAFARVAIRHPRVRLVLKDQSSLYGIQAQQVVQDSLRTLSAAEAAAVTQRVVIMNQNLDLDQLRALHGASDCYVSPYRAEGFNLPVLEAVACGSPVLVTDGGATDEFVKDAESKIPSAVLPNRVLYEAGIREERLTTDNHFLEPNLDALIEMMSANVLRGPVRCDPQAVAKDFSWPKVSLDLLALLPHQGRGSSR